VVTEGAIRSRVKGKAEAFYRAGQAFYEAPHGVHLISENASKTRPAKMLVFFLCDKNTPLVVPPLR
jgi:quercetin dioxygenase-like cupin family protein